MKLTIGEKTKKDWIINTGNKRLYSLVYFLVFISFVSSVAVLILSINKSYYNLLFLVPLSYALLIVISRTRLLKDSNNIGVILLYLVEFIRLVITPFVIALADNSEIIRFKYEINTPFAILLLVYETISVALFLKFKFRSPNIIKTYPTYNQRSIYIIGLILFGLIVVTIVVSLFAPEVLDSYTNIIDVILNDSIPYEQHDIVRVYGTSFFKKFCLVLSNYLLKMMRLFLPMVALIVVHKAMPGKLKLITLIFVLTPLVFVSGSIAVSIHYTFFLLILFFILNNYDIEKIYFSLLLGVTLIILLLFLKIQSSNYTILNALARTLNAYFSGVNIVSGSFNLPNDVSLKIYYCLRDIFGSIPFSGTLFGFSGLTINELFNLHNETTGQIAPTISLGNYYFGFAFAPIYSILFSRIAVIFGQKFQMTNNAMLRIIYLAISYYSVLAFTTYNIEIVLGIFMQVLLPIYMFVAIAYRRKGAACY